MFVALLGFALFFRQCACDGVSGVLKVLHSYILFKTDYFRPFTDIASNKMKGKGFMQMKSFTIVRFCDVY